MSRIERLGLRAKVALSTASQSAGNLLVALGGIAIVRITTRRLGPTGYGTFALIVTYVTLFSMLADLGITAITTIELGKPENDRSAVLSSALTFRVVLSLIVIPIILGSSVIVYPQEPPLFRVAFFVMSLDVLFTTIQVTLSTAFIARVRGDRVASLNIVNRALYVAGVIFVALRQGTYFDYICVYVVADCIVALIYIISVNRSVLLKWSSRLSSWRNMARIALPIGVIQIVGNIYLWIDSIMVSILASKSQLGFYSLGFNVMVVLLSIPMFLMQALTSSLVNARGDTAELLVNRACYWLYCMGVPLAVGGFILRNDAVLALGGPKFLPASTPFAILFITIPISSLQTVFGYASVALDRYRPMLPIAIVSLILNIAFNAFLIPRFGPSGAASALLISESISLIATYLVFRRITGIQSHWGKLLRPTVAALTILPLAVLRSYTWATLSPIAAVCVGGTLIGLVYLAILTILGGLPREIPFRR